MSTMGKFEMKACIINNDDIDLMLKEVVNPTMFNIVIVNPNERYLLSKYCSYEVDPSGAKRFKIEESY